MQIDQHFRTVRMSGTAGNVITQQPDSYAGLRDIGKVGENLGFALEDQILTAQYYNERAKIQLEMGKAFQEYEENLDENDTENWIPTLEKTQELFDKFKIKSPRLRAELPTLVESEKLRQKDSLVRYKKVIDSRNIGREFQANQALSVKLLSEMPVTATENEYNKKLAEYTQSLYGYKLKEGAKEVTWNNLEEDPQYDNPGMLSPKAKKAMFELWLERVEDDREKFLTNDEYEKALTYVQANGEAALKILDDKLDKGEKWGRLDTGQLQALRNNAINAINRREEDQKAVSKALKDDIRNKIQQGTLLSEVLEGIAQRQDIDPDVKNALADEAQKTANLFGKKSADENDPNALAEAYKITRSNKPPDEKFKDVIALKPKLKKTALDGFIKDIYDPKTTELMKDPFYEAYIGEDGKVDTLFPDDPLEGEQLVEYANLMKGVQDIAKEYGTDYQGALAKINALLEKPKEDKAKKIAEFIWNPAWRSKMSSMGGLWVPMGNVPTIKDDKGYEALPSGTVFIDPNGKKRRKP